MFSRSIRSLVLLMLALSFACGGDKPSPEPKDQKTGGRPEAREVSADDSAQAKKLVGQADELARRFQYANAIPIYRRALKLDPGNNRAWRGSQFEVVSEALARQADRKAKIAARYASNGRTEQAFAEFRDAAALDPNVDGFALRYATIAAKVRRYQFAQSIVDGILARNPASTQARVVGAEAAYFGSDWTGVLRYLDDMSFLEAEAANDPKMKAALPQIYYLKGLAAHKALVPATAIDALRASLAADPTSAERQHYLGGILLEEGQFEAAAARFERVLKIQPSHPNAPANLGTAKLRQGKPDEAITWFRRAAERDSRSWDVRIKLGRAYEAKRERADLLRASSALEEAIEINPRAHEAYFSLERVHRRLGNSDLADRYGATFRKIKDIISEQEAALRALATRIQADPGAIEPRLQQLDIHRKYHHNEDVLRIAREILNLNPSHAEGLYYAAQALRVARNYEGSYFEARKLIDAHPEDPRGYELAAWAMRDLQQDEVALSLARKGYELDPNNFGSLEVILAMLQKKGGHDEEIQQLLPIYRRLLLEEKQIRDSMQAEEDALQSRLLEALR